MVAWWHDTSFNNRLTPPYFHWKGAQPMRESFSKNEDFFENALVVVIQKTNTVETKMIFILLL
jgi:hypothetical protein